MSISKLGFKIGEALLPELIEAAKDGIKALTKWFEAKLTSSVEVNEAATQVLVEQAEPIATAVQEGLPEEKDEVAQTMQEGLQVYGGAMVEIADAYAAVIRDLSQLQKLVEEMRQKTDAWASQTVEAKENSLITSIRQEFVGDEGIPQRVSSGARSVISGVQQIQRTGGGASQIVSAGSEEE